MDFNSLEHDDCYFDDSYFDEEDQYEGSAIEDLRWLVDDIFRSLAFPRKVGVNVVSIPRKQILVTVVLKDYDDIIGHIFGKRYANVRSVLQLLRNQQLLPHDRYVRIRFEDHKGKEIITFINTDVSAVRLKHDYNFEIHQLRIDEGGLYLTPDEKFDNTER